MPRLALIHALAHSVEPINTALTRDWPQAVRMNLLDDSLSADLATAGALDERMTRRFMALADYAVDTGADAILFTCSAFGPCIDAVARRHAGIPVLKPNEAMIDEAVARAAGGAIGLVASFGPTLQSMPAEFPPSAGRATANSPTARWRRWIAATPRPTTDWRPRPPSVWRSRGAASSRWRSSAWRGRRPRWPSAPGCRC